MHRHRRSEPWWLSHVEFGAVVTACVATAVVTDNPLPMGAVAAYVALLRANR